MQPLEATAFKSTYGTLNQLEDVSTNDPEPNNGEVLTWYAIEQKWKPGPIDQLSYDISSNLIGDLGDVNTQNSVPDENDILRWDNAAGQWVRSKVDGLGGVKPLMNRTTVAGKIPGVADLFAGELYLNMADKRLYALDAAGAPFAFAQQTDVDGTLDAVDDRYDRVVGGDF